MARDLDVHTGLCVGCFSKPVRMSTGHLHLENGETIFGGWCKESCARKTPTKPKSGCNNPSGCHGDYDKNKHGSLEPEWGD
jgi:hypothetical protein